MKLVPTIEADNVTSLALDYNENMLFYIDQSNQMMKVSVNLSGPIPEHSHPKYVNCPYHSQSINGMDICLRKPLIVTCSDKIINIWNYQDSKLQIAASAPTTEKARAVAFHPNGFHIVAAVGEKIEMMNVLSNQIVTFNSFVLKQCHEIKFSHGGHMFACSVGLGTIHVFNFYTAECP